MEPPGAAIVGAIVTPLTSVGLQIVAGLLMLNPLLIFSGILAYVMGGILNCGAFLAIDYIDGRTPDQGSAFVREEQQ
jgi:hypothetical protein